jgi:hypothetical protein
MPLRRNCTRLIGVLNKCNSIIKSKPRKRVMNKKILHLEWIEIKVLTNSKKGEYIRSSKVSSKRITKTNSNGSRKLSKH